VASELIADSITDFVIGGKGCVWNDPSCSYGKSRVFYHSFMGYFGSLSLDGARQNSADMKSQTSMSVLKCTASTCANGGDCDDSTGVIKCKCPTGFAGFDCATYDGGMSFNGYTSDFTFGATTVPILDNEQTISIEFQKDDDEIGEMLKLNIASSCNVVIKATGAGNIYNIGGTNVTVDGKVITLKLDGSDVMVDGKTVMSCALDTAALSTTASVTLGGSDPAKESGIELRDSRYQGCISKIAVNNVDILRITDDNSKNNVETTKCVTGWLPDSPCDSVPCKNDATCDIKLANYSFVCDCNKEPFTKDNVCNFKNFCVEGHKCDSNHGTCMTLETKAKCEEAKKDKLKEGLECEEDKRWYYYCKCEDGWEDDNCGTKSVVPTEPSKKTDPPKKSDTTTIVVVVVVVAVVLGVVVVIIIVKRRRRGSGNGTSNGKADKGEYSPQAQEKDLEMSRKIDEGAEEPGNLYEDVDVIKNPNAESITEEKEEPPPPPASAETAIMVEPSDIYPNIVPPEEEAPIKEEPAAALEPAVAVEVEPSAPQDPLSEASAPQDPPSDQV